MRLKYFKLLLRALRNLCTSGKGASFPGHDHLSIRRVVDSAERKEDVYFRWCRSRAERIAGDSSSHPNSWLPLGRHYCVLFICCQHRNNMEKLWSSCHQTAKAHTTHYLHITQLLGEINGLNVCQLILKEKVDWNSCVYVFFFICVQPECWILYLYKCVCKK